MLHGYNSIITTKSIINTGYHLLGILWANTMNTSVHLLQFLFKTQFLDTIKSLASGTYFPECIKSWHGFIMSVIQLGLGCWNGSILPSVWIYLTFWVDAPSPSPPWTCLWEAWVACGDSLRLWKSFFWDYVVFSCAKAISLHRGIGLVTEGPLVTSPSDCSHSVFWMPTHWEMRWEVTACI